MIQLRVDLGPRSYPILIGSGLLSRAAELLEPYLRGRLVVVTNPTVARFCLGQLDHSLRVAGKATEVIFVPDGERFKTIETLALIHTRLLELRADRQTTLIALGGGVVGDLAGFAAATYQRGIDFAQIPTTLLAQVDSSVGGKTGINHPLGKNMIGAFHQPQAVLIDTEILRTLPGRELRAGLAEVIKYGLIRDVAFLQWLEANLLGILDLDPAHLAHAISRSCEIKAEIVGADERESGDRALLNLGHTFGHAIEAGLGYGAWLHGEAIAAGMVLAAELSRRIGWLSSVQASRATELLGRASLPTVAPALGAARYLSLMEHDKKNLQGDLRLILLRDLGRAEVCTAPPAPVLHDLLEDPAFCQSSTRQHGSE